VDGCISPAQARTSQLRVAQVDASEASEFSRWIDNAEPNELELPRCGAARELHGANLFCISELL